MDQCADWQRMINHNLTDHEARLQMLETAVKAVDLDDMEYTWPPYDLRTSSERQAARLDNHDQRLRAIEHRLLLLDIALRNLEHAVKTAHGL